MDDRRPSAEDDLEKVPEETIGLGALLESIQRRSPLLGRHERGVTVDIALEAHPVALAIQLRVELGGPDGLARNPQSVVAAPFAGREVDHPGGKVICPILPSHLGLEGPRQVPEEGIPGSLLGQGDRVGSDLHSVGIVDHSTSQGLHEELEAEAGGEGGMARIHDFPDPVEGAVQPGEIPLGHVVVAAPAHHEDVVPTDLVEGRRALQEVVGPDPLHGEPGRSGERRPLGSGHGIACSPGLEEENPE